MKFQVLIYLVISLSANGQNLNKVIVENFPSGRPKEIRYFEKPPPSVDTIKRYNITGARFLNVPETFLVEDYFENGVMESHGKYINGVAEGTWETFYESGNKHSQSHYKNGMIRDSLECWYPSGKRWRIIVEIDTVNKLWHNIDFYENGNKQMECFENLIPGKFTIQGLYKEWHDNSFPWFEGEVVDGKTKGLWKLWNEQGQLVKESETTKEIN